MTNATIFENNSTSNDQINKIICNQSDNGTQNCFVNKVQIQNNHCSNNNGNTTDCETIAATDNNNTNINIEENTVVDKNTVLKYVYKKGDKADIPLKEKGHFKNSLRRKRSTVALRHKNPRPSKFQKPVVVNYETVHGSGEILAPLKNTGNKILGANLADFDIQTRHLNPEVKNDESIAPDLKKESSEIESLNEESNERDNNKRSSNESGESGERGDYKNGKRHQDSDERGDYRSRKPNRGDQGSAERGEHEDYRNKKSSRENSDSSEHANYKNRDSRRNEDNSGERDTYKKSDSSLERGDSGENDAYKNSESSRGHDDSSERGDYKRKRNGSRNNYNSAESNENNRRGKARYSAPNKNRKDSSESDESRKLAPNSYESKESIEIDDRNKNTHAGVHDRRKNAEYLDDDRHNSYPRKKQDSSNESSDESNKSIETREPQPNYQSNPKNDVGKNSQAPLRDVDLGNFNYERVHLNNNGKVEPQKDNLEFADPKSAVEILPLATPVPEIKNHGTQNSLSNVNTLASTEVQQDGNKLIHIDDGEVKPVVEINPESEPNVSEEVESLESILGVKEPEKFNDNGQNDKIVKQAEGQNGDVKQEFERIPVNYNHAKKTENKDNPTTETPKEETEVEHREGTLDVFSPKDVKYDEHLRTKFDDLTIKLPEIKLPDDILAYTRDNSPYSYEDDKKQTQQDVTGYKPYYYDHEDKEKLQKRKDNKDADDAEDDDRAHLSGYYGYYDDPEKKQNYKDKEAEVENEEEEEEDLYEKFVRERFGKQGTFEKRSENLEAAAPANPELYKTIQSILKKTADIDEQAKKSGDPNAGYMWTLEYGEKL